MARVLISMPEEFLNRIDQVATGENRSRSELIREALRTYIYKQKIKESTSSIKNADLLESLLGQRKTQNQQVIRFGKHIIKALD